MTSRGAPGAPPRVLRLLLDTNVFVALEPFAGGMERGLGPAARLVRLAGEQGHKLFVHPATEDDLRQGTDRTRLTQQLAELGKFPMLAEGPIPAALIEAAGYSEPGSNDHRDLRLLAALKNRATAYMISEDVRLRRRAARAGLGESVLTVNEAVALLDGFAPTLSPPPPRVERVEPYALDSDQAIFGTIRADYSGFDSWLDKVRSEAHNRDCLVIRGHDGSYAALTLVKRVEDDCAYDFPQPVTKIATFKVGAEYAGSKYGELLLKTIFADAHRRSTAGLYVEVLSKYEGLIDLLDDFGFRDSGYRTEREEAVLVKVLRPEFGPTLGALEHHITYGPPAIARTARVFLIPIQPRWHDQLFPDSPRAETSEQLLLPGMAHEGRTYPWGNALRKAYLCNSNTTQLAAGDAVLFYRSGVHQTVTAVGVIERIVRSGDPVEIINFVGRRTVYTPEEIVGMCRSVRGVLAILFRQDRFIEPAWGIAELQRQGVVRGWPQSITRVGEGGAAWVHQQLSG